MFLSRFCGIWSILGGSGQVEGICLTLKADEITFLREEVRSEGPTLGHRGMVGDEKV